MPKTKLQTKEFYNLIADQYNGQLTESDKNVRAFVEKEFKRQVKGINILDFGGGTGLDLPWLLNSYKVFFLEPSEPMRSYANQGMADKNLVVIKQNTDFNLWKKNGLPFEEQMDGVLMNFAVLNCIENANVLFKMLAMVCNEDAFLFALVIDCKKIKGNRIGKLLNFFVNKPHTLYNNDRGIGHKIYLHTIKQLKSASREWFDYVSGDTVEDSNFVLLILKRK